MPATPLVAVGRITRTHGLKGEVWLAPAADLPFVVPAGIDAWVVPPTPALRATRILAVAEGPKGVRLTLEGVDSIAVASALTGRELRVSEGDLPEIVDVDEFDPIGISVTDEGHGVLGEVTDVIITGANDVWVVEGRFGEVLIPVIEQVVLEIDEEACTARVLLLDGLLPGTGEEA